MNGYPQTQLTDNSPMGLVDALAKRITDVLKDSWWYPNEHNEEFKPPHVHAQYLPTSNAMDEERDETKDYPLVQVVHAVGSMETLDSAMLKIVVAFGGWDDNDNNQGWRIPMAMLWATLQDLLTEPFAGAYEFVPPVEWTPPVLSSEEHEPPYYTAMLTTTWKRGPIMQETGRARLNEDYDSLSFIKE